ncbi:helix-turn-helix transcriptional regulator [Streptomonospora sp. PA3]|uniref:helix-turn-helix domain-containing protein n=1 Tax=Streptomonospora sp. PA3 TaxID=2607326 RepID=UPI0016431FE0|nr:helix-turn-helix transcriptional regulator [Streptomonospora sp. PA3]
MGQEIQEASRRFGRELTRLREMSGITQGKLASQLGISSSHLSNLERGYRTPKAPVIRGLDKALNAEGRLVRLWEDLTRSGRSAWLEELADIERKAVSIVESQTSILPSVLQTEEYAKSVMTTLSPWATTEEIEASVQLRKKRTEWFTSSKTPIYWAVIDESVIAREVGCHDLMKAQLEHVADLTERGRVSLQIVRGQHPGLLGSFKIISPDGAPDVVYAESAHSGQIIDSPDDVRRFRLVYGAVQAAALSPQESKRLIMKTIEGYGA